MAPAGDSADVNDSERRARRRFHVAVPFGVVPFLGALVSPLLAGSFVWHRGEGRRGPWARRLLALAAIDLVVIVSMVYLVKAGVDMRPPAPQRVRIGIIPGGASDGVGVERPLPGSTAERSGIEAGDVIDSVDGVAVRTPAGLVAEINRLPDAERHVRVRRGGETLEIAVTADPVVPSDLFTVLPSSPSAPTPAWWFVQAIVTLGALLVFARRARARGVAALPAGLLIGSLVFSGALLWIVQHAIDRVAGGTSLGGWLLAVDGSEVGLLAAAALSLRLSIRRGIVPAPHWRPPAVAVVGRGLLYAAGLGARAFFLGFAAWSVTGLLRWSPMDDPWSSATGLPRPGMLLFVLGAVALGPLSEELLFRGLLLPWLERLYTARTALFLSAGLFAVQHLAYGPGVLSIAAIGLVLGWARQRTGGLSAPLFIHTLYNGAATLLRSFSG